MSSFNKILLVLFLLLAAMAAFYLWQSNSPSRTFKENLAQIDTAQISKITIMRPDPSQTTNYTITTFQRQSNAAIWQMQSDSLSGTVEGPVMQAVLQAVLDLQKTKRVVSNTPEKQKEYKVNTAAGALHLQAFGNNGKAVMDIYLGKIAIQQTSGGNNPTTAQDDPQAMMATRQQRPILNTYVRLEGENDIYVVEGMPAMVLNREPKEFLPQQSTTPTDSLNTQPNLEESIGK